ncbi:hypothetical protein QEN19_001021 [Hanseniaspora menglaensis]
MVSTPNQVHQNNILPQYASNNGSSGSTYFNSFSIASPKNPMNIISPRQTNSFFNNNVVTSPNSSVFSPLAIMNNAQVKMSPQVTNNSVPELIDSLQGSQAPKKLKYSRKGCTSCKKRRKKCSNDTGDGSPCWDCKRLDRECVYIFNPKNVKRKNTPRAKPIKKGIVKEEEKSEINIPATVNLIGQKVPSDNFLTGLDLDEADVNLIFQNLNDIVSMKLNDSQLNIDDYNTISLENVFSKTKPIKKNKNASEVIKPMSLESPLNPLVSIKQESFTPSMINYTELTADSPTASILIKNNAAHSLLHTIGLNQAQSSLRDSPRPSSAGVSKKSPRTPIENIPTTVSIDSPITVNTPLESFNLGRDHDKYLKIFYYDCMDSIAPFTQHQINPLRDALLSFAKTEDYLLSSILAIGASISNRKKPLNMEKIQPHSLFNESLENSYNNDDDEKFYCQYLNHCLSLLSTQFQEEGKLVSKIEPIILTVILLAWDCVYSMNSQWRSHLKGVTKLFEKIDSDSKILNLCKCWFKVIETFAHISTVHGGSLIEDDDLDNIFNRENEPYLNSLRSLQVIIPLKSEFNLLRGHSESFDSVIREVIKNLNHIRKSEKNYFKEKGIFNKNLDYLLWNSTTTKVFHDEFDDKLSYFRIQKILTDIDSQLEVEFINKSGIIPIEDPFHPLNPFNEINNSPKDFGVDVITLVDSQQIAISWYDISHQCQVLSFLLIVLLKFIGLPKDSIIIQEIVDKICSKFDWLLTSKYPPENLRTCYCNFAILLAGLNANQTKNRDIVRQYYKLNGKRFERLTKHNLLRLEKTWNKDSGKSENDEIYTLEGQDVLTW